MNDESKVVGIIMGGLVALAMILGVSAVQCGASHHDAITRCIEAGKDPLECKAAIPQ